MLAISPEAFEAAGARTRSAPVAETDLMGSVESVFAVDGAQVGRPEQSLVGHPHAVEWPLQIGAPEREKPVELGRVLDQPDRRGESNALRPVKARKIRISG